MKKLSLLVCLAAPAAFAAELKDHAEVAKAWQDNLAQTTPPLTGDLSLRGSVTQQALPRIEFRPQFVVPPPGQPVPPRAPGLDAPSTKIPAQLPNIRPRGGVPYEYNGEVYWLVPLNAPAGK